MPILIADARQPDFPIVLANGSFVELTQYTAEELLGRNCRILQGRDTSRTTVAEIRAIIDEEREGTVEILNYRKDGSTFWNRLHLSPLRDDEGKVAYYFSSQLDVTEYRRIQTLEEAEHRLLLEVDHRTKNVLAIVDSIVRLSRSDNTAQYAASVQQRVQALSRTHMLLSERGWQEVRLEDIVVRQVSVFGSSRVSVKGPEIMVPAPIVQPIGLAVHELAANAAVHGALSQPQGKLSIFWNSNAEGIVMYWQEEGGPPPSQPSKPGFGNVLLGAVIERQLGGRVTRDWRNDSLSILIQVPHFDGIGRGMQSRP
jgi:PAS domain S-box-containing protein